MAKVAFYAPIKPPDHPIASGDRLIARNLIKALELAGHDVTLASRFIAYSKRLDDAILQERKALARGEADQIIARMKAHPPDLWLTYHPYCKAPDWLGPRVSQALKIPYITVEAARTGQGLENGQDLWRDWRHEAQAGMRMADLHLAFKPQDAAMLGEVLGDEASIQMFPPFIAPLPKPASSPIPETPTPILLAVGMMRPGKKEQNFRLLLEALKPICGKDWHLVLVGEGPGRADLQVAFEVLGPNRTTFTGAIERRQVLGLMQQATLFCWPGWHEPIGMVFLEAQAMGLPVIALNSMGVPLTVVDGKTGLLSAEDDRAAFTANIEKALGSARLRHELSTAGPPHMAKNHSLEAAAQRLNDAIATLQLQFAARKG
ncbi:MAG: glycosyltransferase family 4 protein [Pseudomonadota bacterium]